MAQTIALQRGTTSVYGDGNSSVTLFTQSGGTATRVIPSQLSFYATSSSAVAFLVTLYHTTSGGQTSVLGQLGSSPAFGVYATQFTINNTGQQNTSIGGFLGGGSYTANGFPAAPLLYQSSVAGDMSSSTANLIYSGFNSSGQIQARISYLPANFWIGPGDSLKVKAQWYRTSGKSVIYATPNISYSFVTVTES